jgi:UDP-2,3-diacylglucosamine pyrophosphatase LpxH
LSGEIYVIGDSHIGLADGSEARVNGWLDRLAARAPKALYLNGDLFHYLIAHPKFKTSSVEKVMAKFRELRDERGIAIHYCEGNRDFFLKGSFVEEAVTDIALEYAIPAGSQKFLVIHGDLINDRDWQYRFWRRASKNFVTRLGVNFIPRRMAKNFVDSVERRLSSSNFKHKSRVPLELMDRYIHQRAPEGYTHAIFGHFHEKIERHVADGLHFTVLPPWFEDGEAMVIDPGSGKYRWEVV